MQGQFSHDFLTRGILETVPWQAVDKNQLDAFATELRRAYGIVAADSALNEAQLKVNSTTITTRLILRNGLFRPIIAS